MNRILTIFTTSLAVATLAFAINPTYWTLIITFFVTCTVVIFGLWIESIIKTKGSNSFNKFIYYFTRNDKFYNLESINCTYICKKNNEYECRRVEKIKSNRRDLQGIDEHFLWSANSSSATIKAYEANQKINSIHQEDDRTCFTIDFGTVCPKNEQIQTGSIIENLKDPQNTALPFFSFTVTRKTKLLVITVEFQSQLPQGAVLFKAKALGVQVGEAEVLEYDHRKQGYTKTVPYPRKGWQYLISWEK